MRATQEEPMSDPVHQSDLLHVPTIAEALVKGIRALILSGELRPGERLVEERLAQRFGVSRPPLREALRVLAQDGIVTNTSRRGFFVQPITAQDVREIYELRAALERAAAELSVPVKDPSRLIPIREALDMMRGDAAQNDPDIMLAANANFHKALVALPGNSRLIAAYSTIMQQSQMCMAMNLKFRQQFYNDPQDVVRRHAHLLAALEAGDRESLVHEIAHHGDRSFLARLDELIGGSGFSE
jgi:DNA-binding GntR family transcriptional regulator